MALRQKSTNQIFEKYAKKRTKVTVRKLSRELVLIEGNRDAFEFLGELLLVFAHSEEHMRQFWPKGPGSARFSSKSTLGFYLHMLPCPLCLRKRRMARAKHLG